MQPISSVVKVSVIRGTRTITRAGFGVPLIVAENASFTGIRSYGSYNEVLEDFDASSAEAKAALALFSPERKPPVVKIGKIGATPNLTHRLYFNSGPQPNDVYTITIGTDTYTQNLSPNGIGDNRQGFVDDINAAGKTYTATLDGSYISIQFANAAQLATLSFSSKLSDQDAGGGGATPTSPVDALKALADQDLDFYGVVIVSRDDNDALEVAKYVETQRKMFYYATSDAAAYNAQGTTDFLAKVKALNLTRTFGLYSATADDYPDAVMASTELSQDPGSYTDKFKTLPNAVADKLSSSQIAAIKVKNGNVYTSVGGTDIVAEGIVSMGEFADTIRFIDWLQAQIEENIFALFVSSPKIPMTNRGIAMVEGQTRLALDAGVKVGGIDDYDVVVPDVLDIPQADRQARRLTGLNFGARLAGAIHFTDIDGVVTV
jgi:hypothetical protein